MGDTASYRTPSEGAFTPAKRGCPPPDFRTTRVHPSSPGLRKIFTTIYRLELDRCFNLSVGVGPLLLPPLSVTHPKDAVLAPLGVRTSEGRQPNSSISLSRIRWRAIGRFTPDRGTISPKNLVVSTPTEYHILYRLLFHQISLVQLPKTYCERENTI